MPNRFLPAGQNATLEELIRLQNANFAQIDSEGVTKAFKQANGNAILEGRLPYGGYGSLYYDESGKARVLVGIYKGRPGIWISKDGKDVVEELAA